MGRARILHLILLSREAAHTRERAVALLPVTGLCPAVTHWGPWHPTTSSTW